MLLRIIVRACGRIWGVRRKYTTSRFRIMKVIYSFLYMRFLKSNGSWISLSTRFYGEPLFPHGIYGVFISGASVIGRNCVIFQHVTIGSNTLIDSKSHGAPIVGDNCFIGAGAKIIGNVKIGDNLRRGANTVVYQDVPDNCVVTSSLQKVVQKTRPLNNKFYQKYKGEWRYFENGGWRHVTNPNELCLLERVFHDQ